VSVGNRISMDEFKARTEFGRRYGFELRRTGDWWRMFGDLPGWSMPAAGLLASQLDVAFWSALPAALTAPEPVVKETREVELTYLEDSLLTRMCRVMDEGTGIGILVNGKDQQQAIDHLVELELAHEVLHGDDVVFVAGQPETACGRMVAGCKP